tara:strand:+ start:198 stop:434 length:237 start_codon:yes stop_codon:yes gene_type:complete
MSTFYIVIYLVSFCLLVGCGFAMMYANIRSIQEDMNRPIKRHPEAPEPGEQVMYVDVSQDSAADFEARKKQLEDLYND